MIRIVFFLLISFHLFSQTSNAELLKKHHIRMIVSNSTNTDRRNVPNVTYTYIDSLGLKIRTEMCSGNISRDSTITIYKYNSAHQFIYELTTSNFQYKEETTRLDTNLFQEIITFHDSTHTLLTKIITEGRVEKHFVNDKLNHIVYDKGGSQFKKTRQVVYYYGHKTCSSKIKVVSYYNEKGQLYKVTTKEKNRKFNKPHGRMKKYFGFKYYYYDADGFIIKTVKELLHDNTETTTHQYLKEGEL